MTTRKLRKKLSAALTRELRLGHEAEQKPNRTARGIAKCFLYAQWGRTDEIRERLKNA